MLASSVPGALVVASPSSHVDASINADLAAPAAPKPPKRRSKKRVPPPAQPRRERHPREASHPERLSEMMRDESVYHRRISSKRGIDEDITEVLTTADRQEAESASAPPRRGKKSKQVRPSSPEDDPMLGDEGAQEPDISRQAVSAPPVAAETSLTSSVTHSGAANGGTRHGRIKKPQRTAPPQGAPASQTAVPSRRIKKPKKPSEAATRSAKRARVGDTGPNPISNMMQAMGLMSQTGKRTGAPARASAAAPAEGYAEGPTKGRKRGRVATAPATTEDAREASATSRGSNSSVSAPGRQLKIRLPQRRRLEPRKHAPVPAPGTLGTPASLEEADEMLGDIAAEALEILRNVVPQVEAWVNDPAAQDEPPDSDDEEDVSLAQSAPPHAQVQGSHSISAPVPGRALSAVPLRGTLRSSASTPLSTVPKPVPKPVPKVTKPKPPLTAQPVIWAKVRVLQSVDALIAAQSGVQSRQEVCESFDWFRSYQSGVYFNNDIVKGYLLSAFSAR